MNKQGRFLRAGGNLKFENAQGVEFELSLIIFKEDGATIFYCPALDLSGYGLNEQEAGDSFKYVLTEYFDYTHKKNTLQQDLKRLGWSIRKSQRKKMTPPDLSTSLERNENFKRVFDNYDFKKTNTHVQLPAFA